MLCDPLKGCASRRIDTNALQASGVCKIKSLNNGLRASGGCASKPIDTNALQASGGCAIILIDANAVRAGGGCEVD